MEPSTEDNRPGESGDIADAGESIENSNVADVGQPEGGAEPEEDGRWKGTPHCLLCTGNMPVLRESRPRPSDDPLVWKGRKPDSLALQIANDKTGVMRQYKWNDGAEIVVQFIWRDQPKAKEYANQYKRIASMVIEVAKEWEKCTNVKFRFIPFESKEDADIMLSFLSDKDCWEGYEKLTGHWSMLGQESKTENPSMNLDYLSKQQRLENPATSSDRKERTRRWMRATILHEFGHALGFIHEHLRGDRDKYFELNIDTIIEKNKESQGWTEQQTRDQVNDLIKMDYLKASPFDFDSIMIYPFPPDEVKQPPGSWGNFQVKETFDLSPMDKQWARIVYPPLK